MQVPNTPISYLQQFHLHKVFCSLYPEITEAIGPDKQITVEKLNWKPVMSY